MLTNKHKLPVIVIVLSFVLTSCSFGPPASCGDNIGGTADTTKFDQYFTTMALVNQDGETGSSGDNGMEFTAADILELRADTLSDVDVRACVQNFNGQPIAFDQTSQFTSGASGVSLGSFEQGSYVIRVIVDDTLVKNFPFSIK